MTMRPNLLTERPTSLTKSPPTDHLISLARRHGRMRPSGKGQHRFGMQKADSISGIAMSPRVDWPYAPGEECFAAWQEKLSLLVDCSIPENSDPAQFDFHGCNWQLPRAFLGRNGGSAMTMSRTQQVIDDRPAPHMILYMVLAGEVIGDYDGLIQEHGPGDIVAVDYSLPYHSQTSDYEGITLTVDQASLPAEFQNDAHGLVLTANDHAGAMLGTLLKALVDHIDGLSIDQAQVAVDGILHFAAAAFAAPQTRERRDKRSLFQRASVTARQHLSDPDFGPDELAAALCVSRSKLFRLFEPHSGVQRWLLTERLRASLQSIVQSSTSHKIGSIARAHGFRSEAHFSRAFQRRYQISPSSVRALADADVGGSPYEILLTQRGRNGGTVVEAWLAAARA